MGDGERLKRKLQTRADVRPCCKQPGSLTKVDTGIPGSLLLVCSICGRRHRMIKAEPGMYGAHVQQLGQQ